ncbi:outer membrane protein assembly factor BamE [Pseudogemmobacter faecipullorum]|uniref:outer membrane protein assembly factor BamE n=1 Tax=Pseudogemmobacter faecipullorum TaxID=2755041 RepID=UPI003F49AEAD
MKSDQSDGAQMAGKTGMALRLAAFGLVLLIAACATITRNHGYVPDEVELAQIQVGKDNRESVAEKVGRPSAQGLLNDVGWFYVQSRFEHYGPREPKEVSRQVVVINFTEAGTVSNIGRYGLEDGRVIELSRRVTETTIKGVSFIGQLLGNVGRIDAGSLLGG